MASVVLKDVDKIYKKDIVAVNKINLEVKDGEFLVLVGPSGCGKSSTLRMIAGLEDVTSGTISIAQKVVNDIPPKLRDIAMVFQNYALYPHMSAYDNIAFGLKLRDFLKEDIDKRVQKVAHLLGIDDLLHRRPRELSGGQKQRVAVGRAIVRQPEVFLFDEPLSNLDAKMRVKMRTELSKLHTRLDTTMIYVTHDQTEAMTMGDRIAVMNEGVIQQVDVPIELYNKPINKFVASFIGSPPMNFFEGMIIKKEDDLFFKSEDISFKIPGISIEKLESYQDKLITLGVRPENIGFYDDNDNITSIQASVEVVEPMGVETYIYMYSGTHLFIARMESHKKIVVGDTIDLKILVDKVHFFDKVTELLIF